MKRRARFLLAAIGAAIGVASMAVFFVYTVRNEWRTERQYLVFPCACGGCQPPIGDNTYIRIGITTRKPDGKTEYVTVLEKVLAVRGHFIGDRPGEEEITLFVNAVEAEALETAQLRAELVYYPSAPSPPSFFNRLWNWRPWEKERALLNSENPALQNPE
jgi:hypothetical protein